MDHTLTETDTQRLLVVGELNVDLIVQLSSELKFGQHEQLVESTVMTMGSSSAITACGAARLGIQTSLVAVRGDDAFGAYLVDELSRLGVDSSLGRVDATLPTGSSVHLARPDRDRAILTAMGSIGAVSVADVPPLDQFAHLHVGSYFLQEALWPDAADLFARARAAGLTTSVDGNFDPALEWDRGIRSVLAHADVFFGNEQEVAGITGLTDETAGIDALLELMPAGAVVVFKRGQDGAAAATRSAGVTATVAARPPAAPGAVVDTVGAGDSLAAGFIAARLLGMPLPDALALAVACGTASTRAAGGTAGQPTLAEARELASGR